MHKTWMMRIGTRWLCMLLTVGGIVATAPAVAAGPLDGLAQAAGVEVNAALAREDDRGAASAHEAGAYLSALAFAGEADAAAQAIAAWEDAQSEPHPRMAYLQHVMDRWHAEDAALESVLAELEAAHDAQATHGEAQGLALAAHMLVQAELDLEMAARLLSGAGTPEYVVTEEQRFAFLRPLGIVAHYRIAAQAVLVHTEAGGPAVVDTTELAAALDDVEPAHEWTRRDFGAFHALARHVVFAQQQRNVTETDFAVLLQALSDDVGRDPPNQAYALTVLADAQWWQGLPEDEKGAAWPAIRDNLAGMASGASYEAALLDGLDHDEGGGWQLSLWLLAAAGALVALVVAVAVLQRRRALHALGGVVLLAALAVWAPDAEAATLPADPTQAPVAFTQPEAPGAWGSVAAEEGLVHFVWVACGQPAPGCYDIWHRTYAPRSDAWSSAQRTIDPGNNASLPRFIPPHHVVWSERLDEGRGDLTLQHCTIGACKPTRLSAAGRDAGDVTLVPGPDGSVHAAWQSVGNDGSRIVVRQLVEGAWRAPLLLPSEAGHQAAPTAAMDAEGRLHVVWREPHAAAIPVYRLRHAVVADGAATVADLPASGVEPFTEPSMATLADGTLGVLYNGARETYLSQRAPASSEWSPPLNVSRTEGMASQSEPLLMPSEDGWTAFWRTGTQGDMQLWQATQEDGTWLSPRPLLADAFAGAVLEPSAAISGDAVELAWTGTGPDTDGVEMHYLRPGGTPLAPLEVSRVSPAADTWATGPFVELVVHFEASHSIDLEQSYIVLDGGQHPLELVARHGRQVLVAAATDLADGPHEVQVVLRDLAGQEARHDWAFATDSETPTLEVSVLVDDERHEPVSRWYPRPVTLAARAAAGEGAPAHVELSLDDGASYRRFDDPVLTRVGLKAADGGWQLAEEVQLSIRLRAIDAAGNVQVQPRFALGWDQTLPEAVVQVPAWSRGDVPVSIGFTDARGAPAAVDLAVYGEAGVVVAVTNATDAVILEGLPDGRFMLRAWNHDAAGNRIELAPHAFGKDTRPPSASYDTTTDSLLARDEMSGLHRLDAPGMAQIWDAVPTATIPVHWPTDADSLHFTLHDTAGNAWAALVDRQGAVQTVGGAEEGVANLPSDGKRAPGWSLTPAVAAVLLAVRARGATGRNAEG